jgi:hypothetical protein
MYGHSTDSSDLILTSHEFIDCILDLVHVGQSYMGVSSSI